MLTITSKDNQYLKLARSLQQRKGRIQSGCFLAEGLRLGEEALLSGQVLRYVLLADDASAAVGGLAARAADGGVPVYTVSSRLLAQLTATEHSQGIAMVCQMRDKAVLPSDGHCYALCDGVADPGNLGAIFRSAYAANVAGLILGPNCADPYNPKTVRAAMGALFRLPFYRAAGNEEAASIADRLKLAVYITAMDGQDIRKMGDKLQKPHLWVLGSEAGGVSDFWRQRSDGAVALPMRQGAESLNVAAAATVLFYQSFFVK